MKNHRQLLSLLLYVMVFCSAGNTYAQPSYIEDFSTTVYKDVINTTADWNTGDGELKLFRFYASIVGTCDTPGEALGVTISGDHAYVADDQSGFQVIDITDPTNPMIVGTRDTPGNAYDVAIYGEYAFVADDEFGLQVMNISDPVNPALVGTCDTPGNAFGVATWGSYAFVADGHSGIQIIYTGDPLYPWIKQTCNTPGIVKDLTISGNHAFVADYDFGLQVIDITNPANPSIVGTCDTQGYAYGVTISGDYALVADYDFGLQVIDISDPTSPSLVGACDTPGNAVSISVSGDRVFVGNEEHGLQVIDISDPTNPILAGNCDTPGLAMRIVVAGNHAFVADSGFGLQVIEIMIPEDPVLLGTQDTPGTAISVTVSGDHAFVTDYDFGLQVIDVSDPANPSIVGACDTRGDALDITVSGDYALVADYDFGLQVIDISDPTSPSLVGTCLTPGPARCVAVSGVYAYVAESGNVHHVVYFGNPTNPTIVGTFYSQGDAEDITVSGNHLFLVATTIEGTFPNLFISHNFHVFDIGGDPWSPLLIGNVEDLDYAQCLTVSGDCAYVGVFHNPVLGQYDFYFKVYDLRDPSAPFRRGSCSTQGVPRDITVSGDQAFVVDANAGLQVIDISNPWNPMLMGACDTPSTARGVAISGKHAFVTDYEDGLQVIQVYRHGVDKENNQGQSLVIDDDVVIRTRLTTVQTGNVNWQLSFDAGTNWSPATPDGLWERIPTFGSDLRWRATHTWSPSVEPTVSNLTLDWLNEFGRVASIIDVPDDQGGWVRLSFYGSGYDFTDELTLPVTGYQIYRRADETLAAKFQPKPWAAFESGTLDFEVAPLEGARLWSVGSRVFARSEATTAGTLPPGTWEIVSWVAATQSDHYTIRVSTPADSTGTGFNWSTYLVTTHTTTPETWFACEPDSGYSVDNIAPGIPEAITATYTTSGVALDWADAPDPDFQNYRIYRGTDPGFVPSSDNLVQDVATSAWSDPTANPWSFHYKITTLDYAGNESEAGSPSEVTGVQDETLPARTALLGAVPNPFNPQTTIMFELLRQETVSLRVFDLSGGLVRVLVDGKVYPNGRHEAVWNGRDNTGRQVASGTYFYCLEAGEFSATKRMVLVK